MKRRELKYRVNWQDAWKNMRNERVKKPKITYDKDFKIKFAKDFSKRCKWNDYEFGRKVIDILKGILNKNFEVLEIGPGPGTLTVPLSKEVKKITCIDASKLHIKLLRENLNEKGVNNVEIINDFWENANIENSFDLVVCSHFLWMVEDLEKHLEKMEELSTKYCAIIQPCGRDDIVKKAFETICNEKYTGQFEPDADYFVYVILREWGRVLDVRHFEYSFKLNLDEGVRYIASFLGRFIEVDEEVANKIKNFLKDNVGDSWKIKSKAVVMWWKP